MANIKGKQLVGDLAVTNVTASGHISASGDVTADNLYTSQYIYHTDDSNTYLNLTADRLRFNIGGISYIDLNDAGSAPHDITFNDGGNDVDFIIKGSSNNPLFKTDSSTNRIGTHGKGSPEVDFHIGGDELRVDGTISGSDYGGNVSGSITSTGSFGRIAAADGFYHSLDTTDETYINFPTGDKIDIVAGGINFIYAWQRDSDVNRLIFNEGNTDTDIIFRGAVGSNNNLLRLDASEMKISIGGSHDPTSSLHIAGDIWASGSNGNVTASGNISASGIGSFTGGGIFDGDVTIGNGADILLDEDQRIYFEADKQTWMEANGANLVRIVTNNSQMLLLDHETGNRAVFGNGTKVYIGENNNALPSNALEVVGTISGSGILSIEGNITGSGNISGSQASTGSFGRVEVDSGGIITSGDVTLDGDGGDIILKDGGTEYGRLSQVLGGLTLKSGPSSANAVIFSLSGEALFAKSLSATHISASGTISGSDMHINSAITASTFSGSILTGTTISGSASGSFGNVEIDNNATIDGDLFVSQYIKHKGDVNTAINFTDNKIKLEAGGMSFASFHDDDSAPFTAKINNDGERINFLVYDDNSDLLLKTDSDAFNVGLYFAGSEKLSTTNTGIDVTGNLTTTGNIIAEGDVTAQNYIVSSSVTYMTSSFRSGSTISGDDNDDIHHFTGSVFVSGSAPTDITTENSIFVGNDISASGNITGSQIEASGDVIAFGSSDRRLKDNITPISEPLYKLSKVGGYTFDWNDKQDAYKGHDVGVIAQEIEEILPELVTTRGTGYKAVKYEKIVPLLIESIKELQEKVQQIEENCDCLNK